MGNTGLLWLLLSYGYVLFKASDLISEGSDLLLLVPSLAGLGEWMHVLGAKVKFARLGNVTKLDISII